MRDYNLERFVKAQEMMYEWALKEIKNGRKQTHWMWFIFPQMKGLGRSSTAQYFGIEDRGEAEAYLEHPILGARLREISLALLELDKSDPYEIMGGIDGKKLCSSMTLFAQIEGQDSVFSRVLDKYYGGKADMRTVGLLLGD